MHLGKELIWALIWALKLQVQKEVKLLPTDTVSSSAHLSAGGGVVGAEKIF